MEKGTNDINHDDSNVPHSLQCQILRNEKLLTLTLLLDSTYILMIFNAVRPSTCQETLFAQLMDMSIKYPILSRIFDVLFCHNLSLSLIAPNLLTNNDNDSAKSVLKLIP